jgi:hypothetical protein
MPHVFSRKIPELTVMIDGSEAPDVIPLTVHRSAGGHRLDHASIQFPLAFNQDFAVSKDDVVEVLIKGEVDGETITYFWGELSLVDLAIGSSETQVITARLEPWHFGTPLYSVPVFSPADDDFTALTRPLVFNPLIDGIICGNRHSKKQWDRGNGPMRVFLDPESARNERSQKLQKGTPETWSLTQAVVFICKYLNDDEKSIHNPLESELEDIVDDDNDILNNITLKQGWYLPQCLDALLEPFGLTWFVEQTNETFRRIRIYRRGEGTEEVTANLQAPGEVFSANKTNLKSAPGIQFDYSQLYNAILGQGSFVEIEATFELHRGWPADKDGLINDAKNRDKLRSGHADFEKDGNKDVWRKWVLNEAGDYTGLRDEIKEFYDFSSLTLPFGVEAVPRRRKFLPCLTQDADGHPIGRLHGVVVEYWGHGPKNGTTPESRKLGWHQVAGECRLNLHECTVEFSGSMPPVEITSMKKDAKVRVTASVQMDNRCEFFAPRQDSSPQPNSSQLTLDLSERFHQKHLAEESKFNDAVRAGDFSAYEPDDRSVIQDYCEHLRDVWESVVVSGPLHLEGVDQVGYEIGQSVTSIEGRDVSLSGRDAESNTHYPQIAAIAYDFQQQRTTLQLDHYRFDRRMTASHGHIK